MRNKIKDKRLYDLALVLRRLRQDLGYSSAEKFSNANGLNRSVYQRWESGEDLNITSLIRLCEILEISASDLFRMWEKCNEKMPKTQRHYLLEILRDELRLEDAARNNGQKL
jgi:transcriptional regulator with XRE-family HTH domain